MLNTGAAFDRATLAFWVALIALTAARIWALFHNPVGLYFDEAQYWSWSRSFDWGYFTKPPMVAWVIAAKASQPGISKPRDFASSSDNIAVRTARSI